MIIYLTHLVHGSKVAICDAEAAADELRGWMRVKNVTGKDVEDLIPDKNRGFSVSDKPVAVDKKIARPKLSSFNTY